MKLRIYENHWYPRLLNLRGIVVYPVIFLADARKKAIKERVLHHEWIHVQQIRRVGWIPYYLRWWIEFLFCMMKYFSVKKTLHEISYEREAYAKMWKIRLPEELLSRKKEK